MNVELQERSSPININVIDSSTRDGRWLLAAMAVITTESRTEHTPDQVLGYLEELQKEMFKEQTV